MHENNSNEMGHVELNTENLNRIFQKIFMFHVLLVNIVNPLMLFALTFFSVKSQFIRF